MPGLTLITGGVRSGKSSLAEQLAAQYNRVTYVATARAAGEAEMEERVRQHRARRPENWKTLEDPVFGAFSLKKIEEPGSAILIDCLTLLLTNLLLERAPEGDPTEQAREEILGHMSELAKAARRSKATVFAVTNEVGWGIVPSSRLARTFRDLAGISNSLFAAEASRVFLMVSGIPLLIKGDR